MRPFRPLLVACLLGSVAVAAQRRGEPLVVPPTVHIEKDVMVPARDGVKLATDLYRPAVDGKPIDGRFPVLVERTPYNKEAGARRGIWFAERGYAVVYQDTRGRFKSEGRWWMLVDDDTDGYDLFAWIAKQPWSSGRVGTMGGSYTGATQHALAITRPPGLSAMFVRETVSNVGKIGMRHHGAFELRFMAWIFGQAVVSREAAADPVLRAALVEANERLPEYVRNLPFKPGSTPLRYLPNYEAWLDEAMTHGDYDDYWKQPGYNVEEHYDAHADVPVYHQTGWHDSWTRSSIDNYLGLSTRKKSPQRLIVGPWVHGGATRSAHGDVEFGPDAAIPDYESFMRAWFDRWLAPAAGGAPSEASMSGSRGAPAGAEAPVRIFVMGGGDGRKTRDGRMHQGGRWRDETSWPVAGTRLVPYYLHAGGTLTPDRPPASRPTAYTFDPRRPVPTIGGNISSAGVLMEPGGYDQRCDPRRFFGCEDNLPLAARNDVLVFETAPLGADTEVTGPLEVKLWVSSTAVDTDFTAKLIDVHPPNPDYPHGFALNLADSIVRMRYRHGLGRAVLLKPAEVVPATIVLYPTSNLFKAGHRIRLDLSSSNFPRFDVNPNTGEPLGRHRRWAVAENTVYHDPERPSHIVLPIVERGR